MAGYKVQVEAGSKIAISLAAGAAAGQRLSEATSAILCRIAARIACRISACACHLLRHNSCHNAAFNLSAADASQCLPDHCQTPLEVLIASFMGKIPIVHVDQGLLVGYSGKPDEQVAQLTLRGLHSGSQYGIIYKPVEDDVNWRRINMTLHTYLSSCASWALFDYG
jgi:hypothetical protein